jgi:hypothetical protein
MQLGMNIAISTDHHKAGKKKKRQCAQTTDGLENHICENIQIQPSSPLTTTHPFPSTFQSQIFPFTPRTKVYLVIVHTYTISSHSWYHPQKHLLDDTGDKSSSDGAATLTEVEALSLLDSHGVEDLGLHLDVVTGHDDLRRSILGSLGEVQGAGDIRGTQEHLGAVVSVETGVATTLLLGENVRRDQELGVRAGGAGLDHDHTTADLLTLDTTEKDTAVVTSLGGVELLLEGLNTGNDGLDGLLVESDELNFVTLLEETTLNTSSSNGTTSSNGENVCTVN